MTNHVHESKTCLVIGAAGGTGHDITRELLDRGMVVHATYHSDKANLKDLESKFKTLILHHCDLSNEQDAARLIQEVMQHSQKIDVLINCASGKLKLLPVEKLSREDFTQDFNLTVLGSLSIYQQIIPVMKKQGSGLIISFISATATKPVGRMSSYIAAKAGLLGLNQTLTEELKNTQIKIVNISPSFVETPLLSAFPPKLLEIEREKQPTKKFMEPRDLTHLITDIMSKPDKYHSGQNIVVNSKEDILKVIR